MFLSKQASEERSIGKRVNDVIDKRVKEMENKQTNRFLSKQATEEDWRMNSLAAGVVGGGLAGTVAGSRAGRAIGSRPQEAWSAGALQEISAEEKEMMAKIQLERESDVQLVEKELNDWDRRVGQDPSGEMSRQRVEQYGEQMIGVKDRARTDAMNQKMESMRANVELHPSYQKRLLESQRRGGIGGAIAGAGIGAAGIGLGARALYDHHHEKQAGNIDEEVRLLMEMERHDAAVELKGKEKKTLPWQAASAGYGLGGIAGALIGKKSRNAIPGAAVGASVGGLAGYVGGKSYEHKQQDKEAFTQTRDLMDKIAATYAPLD